MTGIPPLAGLCSYQEAARLNFNVDDGVRLMLRYAWVEKLAMDAALLWMNPTPDWEVKEAMSLHLYQDADHARMFRARISEMRNPPPRMDVTPDDRLDTFFNELLHAENTLEKLVGLYGVLKPALLQAYKAHYAATNPLVDHPTRRILRFMILEEEDTVAWGEAAIAAVIKTDADRQQAAAWAAHLHAYLAAAGGITGNEAMLDDLPAPRGTEAYQPDFFPRRDARFTGQWNFIFPPHEVARTEGVPVDEKTLALMCKRALEMDVPETMARMIVEAKDQPWDYYVEMARQLWDEARHAMMGSVYFEQIGVDWKQEIPLHVGFALRLNLHMEPLEAHAVLYTIEQSLMPAETGKKYEWKTADEAANPLAKLYQDYDWADEVLHAQIGRRWAVKALGISRDEVIRLGQRKAEESEGVLAQYMDRGEQVNWWPDFVRKVLGREPAAVNYSVSTSDPVYRGEGD